MNNTFKKAAVILFTAGSFVAAQAESNDKPGTWLAVSGSGYLDTNKTVKVFTRVEERFSSKALSESHAQVSVSWKVTDWFSIAPRVQEIYARNDGLDGRQKANKNGHVGHGWDRELRVGADGTFNYDLYGWKVSDRNRIVYRIWEDDEGAWRYRNQIRVAAPWKWTDYKINPYASFEFFLDDGKPAKHVRKNDKFDVTWSTVGFKAALSKNTSLDLFYRLVDKKDTGKHDWTPHHVIGVYLDFVF